MAGPEGDDSYVRFLKEEKARKIKEEEEKFDQAAYLFRAAVTVVFYPIDYAKTLMQMGYEPVPPESCLSLFQRPRLALPNTFKYILHIKRVDGFFGCYRGLYWFCVYKFFYVYTCDNLQSFLKQKFPDDEPSDEFDEGIEIIDEDYPDPSGDRRQPRSLSDDKKTEPLTIKKFCRTYGRDFVCRITAITLTYPFHVVACHCMASFVGREPEYSGSIVAMNSVYFRQGLLGYYNGFVPRILGEICSGIIFGGVWYFIKSRVANEELQTCLRLSLSVLLNALIYPFNVVSSTMSINGRASRVKLGSEPYTPEFKNWIQCWQYLSDVNQLRRGSSLFFRYYTGPTTSITAMAGKVLRPRRDMVFGYPPRSAH